MGRAGDAKSSHSSAHACTPRIATTGLGDFHLRLCDECFSASSEIVYGILKASSDSRRIASGHKNGGSRPHSALHQPLCDLLLQFVVQQGQDLLAGSRRGSLAGLVLHAHGCFLSIWLHNNTELIRI